MISIVRQWLIRRRCAGKCSNFEAAQSEESGRRRVMSKAPTKAGAARLQEAIPILLIEFLPARLDLVRVGLAGIDEQAIFGASRLALGYLPLAQAAAGRTDAELAIH